MLNCKDVTAMCSREMEQPLRLGEKLGLHTHLMMCTGCSNFRKQMGLLRLAMQSYAQGKAASPDDGDTTPGDRR